MVIGERTNPYIRSKPINIFSFKPTPDILALLPTQKVNQKVVLSFYGNKIDMPFKFINANDTVTITSAVAIVEGAEHELVDSYKVEIIHPLGMTYFRCDIPRDIVAKTMNSDAFSLAELNVRSKREFEDYLINRKQYDLDFSAMDLSHRQARLARKYEGIARSIDVAMGAVTTATSLVTGGVGIKNIVKASMQKADKQYGKREDVQTYEWLYRHGLSFGVEKPKKPRFASVPFSMGQTGIAMGVTAYKGIGGLASGIAGLASISERAALQEEGFGLEIKNKALQSYTIDLSFDRERDEQLMTMRRLFANETYNEVTSRQRQKRLDELETPKVTGEIYLEVWTTSGQQQNYVKDYHDKFGVDCRVVRKGSSTDEVDKRIHIRDKMRLGIYCIEDVVIENLADRIELEFLKARLIGGIKFINGIEHERVEELTPIDKKVKELQDVISEKDRKIQEQEQQNRHLLQVEQEKYHTLSESFRQKEGELEEQHKLVGLYRDEVKHLKSDLIAESSKHSSEKEEHSRTVESLTNEKNSLTQQVDRQIVELQEKDKTIKQKETELIQCKRNLITRTRERDLARDALIPVTAMSQPYAHVDCKDKSLIVEFNSDKQAGVVGKGLSIMANLQTKKAKVWNSNQQAQYKAQGYTRGIQNKNMGTSQVRGKLQLENIADKIGQAFPYFDTVPSKKEDKLGCPVYFKKGADCRWLNTQEQGAELVDTYGKYLEVLGLDLDGDEVVTQVELLKKQIGALDSCDKKFEDKFEKFQNLLKEKFEASEEKPSVEQFMSEGETFKQENNLSTFEEKILHGMVGAIALCKYQEGGHEDCKIELSSLKREKESGDEEKQRLNAKVEELNTQVEELEEKSQGLCTRDELQAKEQELEETKHSLQAVREIEKKLREEIKEEIWRKKTYTEVMNYSSMKYTNSEKPLYPYVITGGLSEGDDKLYVCQFVKEKMCYVHQPHLKVKKYSSYAMLIITDPSNSKSLEGNYPLNNGYSYGGESVSKWSHLGNSLLLSGNFFHNNCNMGTTNLQVRVLEPKVAFPCFLKTPTSKQDKPIGESFGYSPGEGGGGSHHASKYNVKNRGSDFYPDDFAKQIYNYGEYLEAMGLEAVEREDGTIEKIVAKKRERAVA